MNPKKEHEIEEDSSSPTCYQHCKFFETLKCGEEFKLLGETFVKETYNSASNKHGDWWYLFPSQEIVKAQEYFPPLDCTHEELKKYILSMQGGERVQEMEKSGMHGMKGTVEIRGEDVLIRWDHQEYDDVAGVMVTSFTGGARIITENTNNP
jgi:hypothetical protein